MKPRLILYCAMFILLALVACSRIPKPVEFEPVVIEPAPPKPVIFDTDMAHEDMFAALFLLKHPHVDLKAITVVGTGEAHCQPGVSHAQSLALLAGKPEIPVACGRETPLQGDHQFPAEWRRAVDNVYGVELPANPYPPSELTAPELIAQIVGASPQPVTLVAVGPLTNLAEALSDHPQIIPNIAAIYIMGGAIKTQGNVGRSRVGIDNPYAEWNIYIDPLAANQVLASGAPVTLVPLDATSQVPITPRFYKTLGKERAAPAADLVYNLLSTQQDLIRVGQFHFWDSFTAAVAVQADLAQFEKMTIRVVEAEGEESGWTQVTPDGYPLQAAMTADAPRFEALLLTVLNRETP